MGVWTEVISGKRVKGWRWRDGIERYLEISFFFYKYLYVR